MLEDGEEDGRDQAYRRAKDALQCPNTRGTRLSPAWYAIVESLAPVVTLPGGQMPLRKVSRLMSTRAGKTLRVVAGVPGSALSRDALMTSRNVGAVALADDSTAYEIHVDVVGAQVEVMLWSQGIESPLPAETRWRPR